MDSAHFTDKEIAKKPYLVHEVKAIDNATGRVAMYYVYVDSAKTSVFLDALAKGQDMNLEHYGKVIAACYGDEPTDAVKEMLNERFLLKL
jgi:hypothetical protein